MEELLNYSIHKTRYIIGTTDVDLFDSAGNLLFTVSKYKDYYQLRGDILDDISVDSDIVQDPKNISEVDYQLLKILNPNVTNTQFNIFKELKLYLDNHQTEDYTLDQVKQILKDKGE